MRPKLVFPRVTVDGVALDGRLTRALRQSIDASTRATRARLADLERLAALLAGREIQSPPPAEVRVPAAVAEVEADPWMAEADRRLGTNGANGAAKE